MAEKRASSEVVAGVLLGHVERGSTVYTDKFRGYGRISRLGYKHLSVRRFSGSTLLVLYMLTGAESKKALRCRFLLFKRGVSLWLATFYAFAFSVFVKLYTDATLQACHLLL